MKILISDIYVDPSFNCRNAFLPHDCEGLAADIKARGQLSPITVREFRPGENTHGKKYFLIAGHRRYVAMIQLSEKEIEADVRPPMSDLDAHDINAIENLQRENLNLQEEARAIKHLVDAGYLAEAISKRINMPIGWVVVRMQLLDLPLEVQELAAQGLITQADIRLLHRSKSDGEHVLRLAAELRDKRRRFAERETEKFLKKGVPRAQKKMRNKKEIELVLDIIRDGCLLLDRDKMICVEDFFSINGNSLITRALSWAGGFLSNEEFWEHLNEFGKQYGTFFKQPTWSN